MYCRAGQPQRLKRGPSGRKRSYLLDHGTSLPSCCHRHLPGQFLRRLLPHGRGAAVRRRLHHAQGLLTPLNVSHACFQLAHLMQDISASSQEIFTRTLQNASRQASDTACHEVLRPVLSILSSWPSSLPAQLFLLDVLSIMRACAEVTAACSPVLSACARLHS